MKRRRGAPELDWAAARERIAAGMRAAAELERPSEENEKQLLLARARALSRPVAASAGAADTLEVVLFVLGDERWAIETRHVREVAKLEALVPVPGTPEPIVGITNHRGEMLAVVDLRKLYDLRSQGLNDLPRMIVAGDRHPELGVLADAVTEVSTIERREILEAPGTLSPLARAHVAGVTRSAVIVLDGGALLRDPRLHVEQSEEA